MTEDLKEASRGNNSRSIRICARSDSVDYTRDRALVQARWNACGAGSYGTTNREETRRKKKEIAT